jgi:hypothetical protein
MLAALISEPRLWTEWLAQHPDRSDAFAAAFRQVARLEHLTQWPTETLLVELGCGKTQAEASEMTALDLEQCCSYFDWVEDLVGLADVVFERRRIVSGAARIYRGTHGDMARVEEIMSAGDFPAIESLNIGEVENAWTAARQQLQNRIGDRARNVAENNPFSAPRPHLRQHRIDQYRDPRSGMSQPMRDRITAHLKICDECREIVEGGSDPGASGQRSRAVAA